MIEIVLQCYLFQLLDTLLHKYLSHCFSSLRENFLLAPGFVLVPGRTVDHCGNNKVLYFTWLKENNHRRMMTIN
jgi:hypothetical protein